MEAAEALLRRVAPGAASTALQESVRVGDVEPGPWHATVHADEETMAPYIEAVRTHGLGAPLLLRRRRDGTLQLLSGLRPLLAARAIGMKTVPARVVEVDDATAVAVGLAEELLRENVTPWEEAEGLSELRETLEALGEPAGTDVLTALTGRDADWVSERVRIGRRITPEVLQSSGRSVHDMNVLSLADLLDAAEPDPVEERGRRLREAAEAGDRRIEGSARSGTGPEEPA